MSGFWAILALVLIAIAAIGALVFFWRKHRVLAQQIHALNTELVAASADASVGRRLSKGDGEFGDLATTINRLFDAIGERDEKIQGRDRLFSDFAKTLPEIVLIHDERIRLANDGAANLIGLSPEQLEGREVADLVKPAYRALFRKTVAQRLAGETAPRQLEIQLINGAEQGLWVEARSSLIEYRGTKSILTVARDVSHRKSLEVSLSRSKRQAQYTLESISEGFGKEPRL